MVVLTFSRYTRWIAKNEASMRWEDAPFVRLEVSLLECLRAKITSRFESFNFATKTSLVNPIRNFLS